MTYERCTKLGERLSGYHDGVLDAAARAQVEEHLRGCATCRARLAEYAAVDRALGALSAPVLEDRLREELVAYTRESIAVRGRAARRGRLRARLRSPRTWVPLAAAAVVLLVVWRGMDLYAPPEQSLAKRDLSKRVADAPAHVEVAPGKESAAVPEPEPVASGPAEERFLAKKMAEAPAEPFASPESPPPTTPAPSTPPASPPLSEIASDATQGVVRESDQIAARPADKDESAAARSKVGALSSTVPPPASEVAPGSEAMSQAAAPAAPAKNAADTQERAAGTPQTQSRARGVQLASGRLDPTAALSIATLAFEVGDLTGARLALGSIPVLPADTLTTRAAHLALALAMRTGDSEDCKQARERADAITATLPSGPTADTLRTRRAALQCPP